MEADEFQVYLEAVSTQTSVREWHTARLKLDIDSGEIRLRFKSWRFGKEQQLAWPPTRIRKLEVERYSNPHGRLYEIALLLPLIAFFKTILDRYQLEDTLWSSVIDLLPLLLAAGGAALLSMSLKVPVLRITMIPADSDKGPVLNLPLRETLRERIRKELRKQGREVSDAELEAMINDSTQAPALIRHFIGAVIDQPFKTVDPYTFRLHGTGWAGVRRTEQLLRTLTAWLEAQRGPALEDPRAPLDWERAQWIVGLSQFLAAALFLGVLGAAVWQVLGRFL